MTACCKSVLVLAFMLCAMVRANGQAIVEPLNREVALAGELRKVHGYGPPGYGETKNVRYSNHLLGAELPNPVNVICTPEKPRWAADDCKATKRLKLFFPTSPADNEVVRKATAMKGRQVIATGILHRADTVGEITPIYMDVTHLQPVQNITETLSLAASGGSLESHAVPSKTHAATHRLKGDTSPQNGCCRATFPGRTICYDFELSAMLLPTQSDADTLNRLVSASTANRPRRRFLQRDIRYRCIRQHAPQLSKRPPGTKSPDDRILCQRLPCARAQEQLSFAGGF